MFYNFINKFNKSIKYSYLLEFKIFNQPFKNKSYINIITPKIVLKLYNFNQKSKPKFKNQKQNFFFFYKLLYFTVNVCHYFIFKSFKCITICHILKLLREYPLHFKIIMVNII